MVQRLEAGLMLLEKEIDRLLLKAMEKPVAQPFRPEEKVVSRN